MRNRLVYPAGFVGASEVTRGSRSPRDHPLQCRPFGRICQTAPRVGSSRTSTSWRAEEDTVPRLRVLVAMVTEPCASLGDDPGLPSRGIGVAQLVLDVRLFATACKTYSNFSIYGANRDWPPEAQSC